MPFLKESLKDTPLFDYLEEKQNKEVVNNLISQQNSNLKKLYLANLLVFLSIIFSVCFMFFVQFKVDNLKSKINLVQNQINKYEDEIKLLDIEWTYLTRPSRLRSLSEKYITDNKVASFSQIKNFDQMKNIYLANSKKAKDIASLY